MLDIVEMVLHPPLLSTLGLHHEVRWEADDDGQEDGGTGQVEIVVSGVGEGDSVVDRVEDGDVSLQRD